MNNPLVVKELKKLAKARKGLLLPEDVVEAARPKSSPLHDAFCWDDDEAARQYRLWQARSLIRTTVTTVEIDGEKREIRAFVSLTPDRENEGGGYRELIAVLNNADAREVLLADALSEMNVFRRKYAELRELAELFGTIDRVSKNKKKRWQTTPDAADDDTGVRVNLDADPKQECVRLLANANASVIESRSLLEMLKIADDFDKLFAKTLNSLGELRFAVNERLVAS